MNKLIAISMIAIAIFATSCGDNKEIVVSGDAPAFVQEYPDTTVTTVLDTATRYYAATDSSCRIVNGARMQDPALLGVSTDTSVAQKAVTISGDSMNASNWYHGSQLGIGDDESLGAVDRHLNKDGLTIDDDGVVKQRSEKNFFSLWWWPSGLLWKILGFILGLALIAVLVWAIIRFFQWLLSLPGFSRRDSVVESLTGTINTLATSNTNLAASNTAAVNTMAEELRRRSEQKAGGDTHHHYYGDYIEIHDSKIVDKSIFVSGTSNTASRTKRDTVKSDLKGLIERLDKIGKKEDSEEVK